MLRLCFLARRLLLTLYHRPQSSLLLLKMELNLLLIHLGRMKAVPNLPSLSLLSLNRPKNLSLQFLNLLRNLRQNSNQSPQNQNHRYRYCQKSPRCCLRSLFRSYRS
jgi:hypothetical protein